MRKRFEVIRLIKLYLAYHMNFLTFIILGIMLILWSVVLFLNAGIPLEMEDYLRNYKMYHFNYFDQSLYVLQILDAFIISFLIGTEVHSFSTFDSMFVANVNRLKVIIAKLISNFLLFIGIQTFQILLLYLIPTIFYPNYLFELKALMLILFFPISFLILFIAGELILVLFHSYFVSILIFILYLVIIISKKIENISKIVVTFIPNVTYKGENIYQLQGNLFVTLSLSLLLVIGISLLFQKKDLKNYS